MWVALAALGWCASWSTARAAPECETKIVRANVVRCAVSASLALQRERQGVEVEEARRLAVSPLLPSNPALALSGARRQGVGSQSAGAEATNWYATLSQEVEIAGQRGARRSAASAAKAAQQHSVAATERDIASDAWRAYFEVLAAREALDTAVRLEQAFARVGLAAQAGAASGLLSGVDADVAELAVVRLSQTRVEAQRRADTALAALTSFMGLDPASARPEVEGELAPLANAEVLPPERADAAVDRRPELAQAAQTREAYEHTVSAFRRARVPNLTISAFAQRDGFDERVLGGGVSLPVPLPSPLGRTYAGQIAENEALVRQTSVALESARRAARLELTTASKAYEAALAQRGLYTEERSEKAERSLESIASELAAGRLSLSSVVVMQQTLIEFLRASIDAKLAVCVTSVELVRTSSLPLDGGAL